LRTFSTRDAHHALSSPDLTAEELGKALARLAERQYVRRVADAPPENRRGQPPSPRWTVNPRWNRAEAPRG
jgi:hypothetical protein